MTSYRSRTERIRLEKKVAIGKMVRDWLFSIVLALIIAVVIRIWVFEPVHVTGPSMLETMQSGNFVMVNKWIYKVRPPKRGEVIVFHAQERKDYIKRVIALPGETVEAKNNKILINGNILEEPYINEEIRTQDFPLTKVPPGTVFVLGDNRMNSLDSRILGAIPVSAIIGRADLIYWPIQDVKSLW